LRKSDIKWALAFLAVLVLCGVTWAQGNEATATPIQPRLVSILAAVWAIALAVLRVLSLPTWKETLRSMTFWAGFLALVNELLSLLTGKAIPEFVTSGLATMFAGAASIALIRNKSQASLGQIVKLAVVNGDAAKI
jgi:hypothetical protein